MPQAVIWAVALIGAEVGSAFVIMYATEIAYAAIILGGLAYSSAKARQAKQQARDQYNAAQVDRLASLSTALAPRDLVLGRVRKGGTIFYKGSTGTNQKDLYMAVALAGHEIDAVEQIYLNDVAVTLDSSGFVTTAPYNLTATLTGQGNTGAGTTLTLPATYVPGTAYGSITVDVGDRGRMESTAVAVTVSGLTATAAEVGTDITYQYTTDPVSVRVTAHLGAPGQTADASLVAAFPDDWGSANTVEGVAYLVLKLTYSEKAFPTGVPNVSATVRGAKVYDPRTALTAWSDNPALLIRHVYQHDKFGKASVSATEDARFIAVANACDTSVTYTTEAGTDAMGAVIPAANNTAKLYRSGVVAPFGTPARSLMDDLSQAMGGSWAFAGGELYLKPGVYSAPVMALTDADLAVVQRSGATESQRPISISVHKERAQKFNTVKATIWDAAQDYKQVALTPLVGSALVTRDGVALVQEVTLPAIGYAPQALHVAGIMMRDARDALLVDLPVKLRAYPLELFDTITLTLSRYGWSAKAFMVMGRTWNPDGSIQLTLKETSASITQMDSGFLPQGFAANTNLPKPWLVAAVGPLTISSGTDELLTQGDGTIVSRMRVSWPQVQDAAVVQNGQIEVQYRRADSTGAWTSLVTAGNETTVVTSDVQDGIIYIVRARARTSVAVGDWSTQTASNVAGKTNAPAAPVATAVGGMFMVQIAWTFADSHADMRGTEIWWSATNVRDAAARLSFEPYPGTSYQHIGLSAGQGGYYWLRVVNTSAVVSAWYPSSATAGLYAVASADASALLTQLNDALGVDQLTAGLNSRIDLIDGNTTQPALPYPLVQIAAMQDGLNQQVRLDLDAAANSLLEAAVTIGDTLQTFHDAGVYTDPADGLVKIYAIEAANDHLNTVDLTLDAQAASIALKASVTYVDGAIAAATLGAADLVLFDGIDARLTTAELDIDGLNAAVTLKAAATDLTATNVRMTSAEADIDGLQADILLKVSSADFTSVTGGLDTRIGSAETSLSALGDTSSITSVVQQSNAAYRKANTDAETLLRSILNNEASDSMTEASLALARQELTAYADVGIAAEAAQRLLLGVTVAANGASLEDEKLVRASADSAEASARLALAVQVAANAASIVTEQSTRATADSAEALARTTLAARVTTTEGDILTNAGSITTEQSVRAAADGVLSVRATDLEAAVSAIDGTLLTKAATSYVDTAKADAISAAAATTALVSARLDTGDYAAVKTESSATASAVTGLKAKHTVTLDVNGYVSGTESVNTGTSSSFTVLADKFLVAKPDGSGTPIPMMALGTVNGVTALGVNGDLIVDGTVLPRSIDTRSLTIKDAAGNVIFSSGTPLTGSYIADLAVDSIHIKDGAVTLSSFSSDNGFVRFFTSGSFSAGSIDDTFSTLSFATLASDSIMVDAFFYFNTTNIGGATSAVSLRPHLQMDGVDVSTGVTATWAVYEGTKHIGIYMKTQIAGNGSTRTATLKVLASWGAFSNSGYSSYVVSSCVMSAFTRRR